MPGTRCLMCHPRHGRLGCRGGRESWNVEVNREPMGGSVDDVGNMVGKPCRERSSSGRETCDIKSSVAHIREMEISPDNGPVSPRLF